MEVTIVLPTYNKAENIQRLLPLLLGLTDNVRICIVDDHSPDSTGRIADEWAAREPRVGVVHRTGKLGLGTAYIAGFHHALERGALERGADGVLTMDADFSHHSRYIPAVLERAKQADLVIGSRYVPGGRVNYPFHRRVLSRTANLVARLALGLHAQDCAAGFRLYRDRTLKSGPPDRIFSNGYLFLVEMLALMEARGYHAVEVPIVFDDRRYGQSEISSREIVKAMYTVLRLAARCATGRL